MPIHDPQRAFFIPVLIPVGTSVNAKAGAYATFSLIALNVIGFVAGLIAPGIIEHLAFYPHGGIHRAVTHAFVYEPSWIGLGHLFFNMLFLWIFARPLESRIGWKRLPALYLICAAAGAIAWDAVQSAPRQALLGSSGAVWGVMGAYFILWPYSTVKCYFVLLAIIVPIFARAWNTLAILFPAFYYLFIAAMIFCAWAMGIEPLIEHVAWSAHVGGMLAGATLAGAAYGFGAFKDQKPAAKSALEAIGNDSDFAPAIGPANPEAVPPRPQPPQPIPNRWIQLHEAVIMGDSPRAVQLWHELMKPELNECLMPGPQLDLARMLASAGQPDEAIEALDRLLRIHHDCELAPMASLELSRLLIDNGRDPDLIASLLDTIEAAQPADDVRSEIDELRGRLATPHAQPRSFLIAPAVPPPPVMEPLPSLERPASNVLFGDPEDTDAFDLKLENGPAKPAPKPHEDTTPPSEIKVELAKFDSDPEATRRPIKPAPSAINAAPDYKYEEDTYYGQKGPDTPGRRVANESFEPAKAPVKTELIEFAPAEEHVPTAEIFIGDITHFPNQPESTDTGEQHLYLRQSTRYAAILTPGRPVNIPLVCDVLRPILGLGPDPTHHAVLRRRGILAEDLLAVEAEALAQTFVPRGQSITVVAMDKHIDFGEPLDVMTYKDEGSAGRFSVTGQALTCRWSQAVMFAAGLVRLDPTSPGRAVLDLFFSHPRVHLRLWESTMVYPEPIIHTARVLETIYAHAPSEMDRLPLRRDWCFRALATEFEERGGRHAIRTRSLVDWLRQAMPLPAAHFWSPIEYENFLRWHLMAYHAPKKVYG